ncbi:MAG: hypothetical protein AAGD11_18555 [Planctomycetota bacterium]
MSVTLRNRYVHIAVQKICIGLLCLVGIHNIAAAQSILVTGPEVTDAGNERFIFWLDISGGEGTFDTFELTVQSPKLFNQAGEPGGLVLIGSSEDSGFDTCLVLCNPTSNGIVPAHFGAFFLSGFGLGPATDTDSLVAGTFASLGSNDASNLGSYDIAQVVTAPGGGGTYSYGFYDDGNLVNSSSGSIAFGVPEPGTLALAVLASLGLSTRGLQREIHR